jgi:YesN/AraC family two-component response regulator
MATEYPEVDLPEEIIAWPDVNEDILNIYKQSCQLQTGIFVICLEGEITATINMIEYHIKRNDLTTLLPGTIIQIKEKVEKVKLSFIGFSSKCLSRVNLAKQLMTHYDTIIQHPVIPLSEAVCGYINSYFSLISQVTFDESLTLSPAITENILSTVITGITEVYRSSDIQRGNATRKDEICKEFIKLVTQHYATERKAQFYADKMGVTLQYLSTTVKQVTGKNILDLISYVVITDAKSKLKSTNMTIQEISYSLNFPNASFFGKYFKRNVGMTPLEFRES